MKSAIKKGGLIFVGLLLTIIIIGQFTMKNDDTASVDVVSETVLVPGGHSVGVRMDVKGVLIVGLEEIETADGEKVNPGIKAGLQIGDMILEINGTKVYKADEVQALVNKIQGDVKLKIKRKTQKLDINLTPVVAKDDNLYKLGVWVKDKTAGIGTLTYYNPVDQSFGALGHPIVDPETGSILSVDKGQLLQAQVQSIQEGTAGTPGEIRGVFYEAESPLGGLEKNSSYGVFGNAYHPIENPLYSKPLVVGRQDQIEKGKAYILTTLDDNKLERFEIEIEKIDHQSEPSDKGMVIKVTDPRLLEKSGGIVQGMSGSPIIQNNRIIGAVTHVFVNNPKKGYGIFIEWMLQESDS
ncbi:SpoIVB peptidase [Anaerovorax odorimutans]|uniref:SpoIVB peptidase n=1 Tax=Anaerovorax odorimutans TaxID=109327 RepID=A0ABT1RKY0_9FIRM|nr:SpoIVB peptidase [Anaerovorax odorimutans]MCQ4635832.1 SpoIVB peptidase [Anaerovorax odorimutans]